MLMSDSSWYLCDLLLSEAACSANHIQVLKDFYIKINNHLVTLRSLSYYEHINISIIRKCALLQQLELNANNRLQTWYLNSITSAVVHI